jgi:hypothetical protein
MGDKLREFLRSQYGPGRRWKNVSNFSFAAGNNYELIPRMERAGTAEVDSLRKVAKATGEPLLNLMLWADVVTPDEIPSLERRQLTDEEWELIQAYRVTPQKGRQIAQRVLQVLRESFRPPD